MAGLDREGDRSIVVWRWEMTEDMRERGVQSKWNELFVVETEGGEWIDMAGEGGWSAFSLLSEAQEIADSEDEPCKIVRFVRQAALSSAGTSGTADANFRQEVEVMRDRFIRGISCDDIGRNATMWMKLMDYYLRGDSLSGKGEATDGYISNSGHLASVSDKLTMSPANTTTITPCDSEEKSEAEQVKLSGVQDHEDGAQVVGGDMTWEQRYRAKSQQLDALLKSHTALVEANRHSESASALDRAEELAREISDMFNDRGRNYDNQPTVDELASLLRRETVRWIPVSEKLPDANDEYLVVESIDFGAEPADFRDGEWYTVRCFGMDAEPRQLHNVTHWQPLPAPPREEG